MQGNQSGYGKTDGYMGNISLAATAAELSSNIINTSLLKF